MGFITDFEVRKLDFRILYFQTSQISKSILKHNFENFFCTLKIFSECQWITKTESNFVKLFLCQIKPVL